jgi:uncharacterized protein YjlB
MRDIETMTLALGSDVPNSPLPVLLYRAAFAAGPDLASEIEATFHRNGWRGLWRNGIFGYHHFHDDAHEVLGIAAGSARVQLGGEGGPEVDVQAGDVVVLPAGTGHKRLSSRPDLLVVGGYPAGQEMFATRRAGEGGPSVAERVAAVPLPASDPVEGGEGTLLRAWQAKDRRGR